MPTVNLLVKIIHEKLGILTEEQFRVICFQFGLELDEVTSEFEMVSKEQGANKAQNLSKEIIYKIDVPANRTDLLCAEGLLRALMIFQNKAAVPRYVCFPSTASVKLTMTQATQKVRPFVVAAILRNIEFTQSRYESFIGLQDKLHSSIGRKRSVVSIGTHDIDTLQAPFIYDAKRPCDIKFIPLNESKEFTAEELMVHYSKESHLKPYLSIIKDCEVYPVIMDSRGTVLSFPPIINGDHSKIKISTKNVLIEITATNLNTAVVALDTIVAMFSEYCASPFQVEPVEIVHPDGSSKQYPELQYRRESVSVDYINKYIGINITGDDMTKLLERMGLQANVSDSVLSVEIPPTRHDILHRVDIVEDVAIAYGYNTTVGNDNKCSNVYPNGGELPISKLTHHMRMQMAIIGYNEVLTFVLCSKEDISTKLGRELTDAVHIENPKTRSFQVARTTLLPGILNTVQTNQHLPLPLSLFEVQDVVLKDAQTDTRSRNERRVCAVHYGTLPDFEEVANDLYTLMGQLGYKYHESPIEGLPEKLYTMEDVVDPALMTGRSFDIKLTSGPAIGRIGIIRPSVLRNFGIKKGMSSMFEMKIECFL